MKRLFMCVFLLAILTACTGISAPGSGRCSKKGEVCIEVKAIEPIRFGETVTVTITVTAKKDVAGLGVWLNHDRGVVVEGPQGWEVEAKNGKIGELAASWQIDAKADRPFVFTRKVRFPPDERVFQLVAEAYTPSIHAVDSVYVHLTRAGGKVYLSGTSIPITPELLPVYTVTPGPSPTFIPTPMPFVSPLSTPMRPQSPLATPTRLANP